MSSFAAPKKRRPRVSAFSSAAQDALEVLDGTASPLLVMPQEVVLRHNLPHKLALVALHDKNGGIYLRKYAGTKTRHPGLWGLSITGAVLAGEAREDAARRRLEEELGLGDAALREQVRIPPSEATGHVELTLFTVKPSASSLLRYPVAGEDGMYVDQDELKSLIRDLPHLFTHTLHCIFATGALFFGSQLCRFEADASDVRHVRIHALR